jgi:hypothetical protein
MDISEVGQIAVGGVPVAVLVYMIVTALKWSGMLKNGQSSRYAVLGSSVVCSGMWAAVTLFPQLAPAASVLFTALLGAAGSTLAYEGLQKLRGSM